MSRLIYCSVCLPDGAIGWYAACDCGISLLYALTLGLLPRLPVCVCEFFFFVFFYTVIVSPQYISNINLFSKF